MIMTQKRTNRTQDLVAAGRTDEVRAIIDRHVQRAQATYARIRAEEGRTPDWVQEQISKAHDKIRESYNAELDALHRDATSAWRSDMDRVFGVDGLPGDRSMAAMSLRDAMTRTETVHAPDELAALFDVAESTGDEALARAVARRALESGAVGVFNDFVASRPPIASAAERIKASARRAFVESGQDWQLMMAASGMQP